MRDALLPAGEAIDEANGEVRQARRISLLNSLLEQAWRKGWSPRPQLDPSVLIAKARRQTGLAELGDHQGWAMSLQVLTEALRRHARLNPLGLTIAHGQLTALIANRLRLHALWRRYPEILELPVRRPIVVVGQMRSGSTRVQRLLACDPRLAFTRFFESWNPVPRRLRLGPLDDRRLRGWLALRCASAVNPAFSTIHPTRSAAPDEEIGWHSISLWGSAFEAQWRVPDHSHWCESADPEPAYREFKAMLQTIAWLRGDPGERPWILKVPQFAQDLPALTAVFPDARLVRLSRDPTVLVASSASLVRNQMAVQSDHVDAQWIGREWLRKVRLREERMETALADLPQARVELGFEAMEQDWRGEIRRLYQHFEMPLPAWVEERMAGYRARSAKRRRRVHRYSLAEFGLTDAEVSAAFAHSPISRAA